MIPEESFKVHILPLSVPVQWQVYLQSSINQSGVLSRYLDSWSCGRYWLESVYYSWNEGALSKDVPAALPYSFFQSYPFTPQ